MELLDCALLGVCAVIRLNMVLNEKKRNTFFYHTFWKTRFYIYAASFWLCCLPTQTRRKGSQNLGGLLFCLFFSVNELIAVCMSARSAFYLFADASVVTFP